MKEITNMTLKQINASIQVFNEAAEEMRKCVEQYEHEEKVINAEDLSEVKQRMLIGLNDGTMAESKIWEYWRENPHSKRMIKK